MEGTAEKRTYTRGEFLKAPFDHFKNKEISNEDNLVEYGGEALSVAAMLYLAYKGSQDQLVSYEVKAENRVSNLPDFSEFKDFSQKFSAVVNPMNSQIRNLNSAWQAYDHWVCRTVPVITTDSKGDTTVTSKQECNYEWEEPLALTSLGVDHYKILGWENSIGGLANHLKANQEQAPEAFDLSDNGSSLYYHEKEADKGSQLWIAGLAFGVVGGAFCLYEEALHHMTDNGYGNALIDDKKYIKRRTFLKLAAAGLLSLKIRDLQRAFASENKELFTEIKGNTAKVISQIDTSPDTSFKRVMGTDVLGIRNTLTDIRDRTQNVLNNYNGFFDSDYIRVKPALTEANMQATTSLKSFDDLFNYESGNYQIPGSVDLVNRYLYGTRELNNFAGSKSTTIYTRHLTDALMMALGLSSIAAIGEKVIFPLSDKLIENS